VPNVTEQAVSHHVLLTARVVVGPLTFTPASSPPQSTEPADGFHPGYRAAADNQ